MLPLFFPFPNGRWPGLFSESVCAGEKVPPKLLKLKVDRQSLPQIFQLSIADLLRQAENLANSGKNQEALESVESLLSQKSIPSALFLRGYLKHRLGEDASALEDVKAAWDGGYDGGANPTLNLLLIPKLYINLKNTDKALAELDYINNEKLIPPPSRTLYDVAYRGVDVRRKPPGCFGLCRYCFC